MGPVPAWMGPFGGHDRVMPPARSVSPAPTFEVPSRGGSARTQGDGAGGSAQRGTSGAATGPGGRSPLPRNERSTRTSIIEFFALSPELFARDPRALRQCFEFGPHDAGVHALHTGCLSKATIRPRQDVFFPKKLRETHNALRDQL